MELRGRLLDPEKKRRGVWLEYEGARFQVRHMPTPDSTWRQLQHIEAWRAESGEDGEEVPDAVRHEALDHALAECALVGWEGVVLDGEDYPPTPENKLTLIQGDGDFRGWLVVQAMARGNFRSERIQKEAETLGNGSSGASRGGRASKSSKQS